MDLAALLGGMAVVSREGVLASHVIQWFGSDGCRTDVLPAFAATKELVFTKFSILQMPPLRGQTMLLFDQSKNREIWEFL